VPDDAATHNELMALHRRRGDFEALDRALAAQAWRAADRAAVLELWRSAARNVDDNIPDPKRAVQAWHRVLDLRPDDADALRALVGHHRTLGQPRQVIAALEAELRALPESGNGGRAARALEVARMWEAENARAAALAAYERVLRWNPTDKSALDALGRLHAGREVGSAVAALEVAAAVRGAQGDAVERIALLRRALELADPADKLGRFYGLRRILWLSDRDPSVLAEVERAAEEAGAWDELAAVYLTLASDTLDPEARASHHRALARLYEERLKDPVRALLILQATYRLPANVPELLAAVARLGDATGRHEDLLAFLDGNAGAEVRLETRRQMLRQRQAICEQKLAAPGRAFAECARLLALDPHDEPALADARRLADERGLHRALDALYAELWDRAQEASERIAVARARYAVQAEKLKQPTLALEQLLLMYRLDPEVPGLTDLLLAAAESEGAWDRVLPVVEAKARAVGAAASPDDLHRLAGLHEQKRKDLDRAFELFAEAFVLRPTSKELEEDLARLAEATARHEALAAVYRVAAARAEEPQRKLALYRHITQLHIEKLGSADGALDAHRQILQLDPASLPSLEALIERHRAVGEWRELRDRLVQCTEYAPSGDEPARLGRWLEIARLSRDHLDDPESALTSYARVLEIDAANAEALEGVRSLGDKADNPRFELRRLRVELPRAEGARRVEIQLACAAIERGKLDDDDAAMETLRQLVAETGAAGPGFEPLAQMLRERGAWDELADRMEARAAALAEAPARIAALEEAVVVCDEHLPAGAQATIDRKERLYKRLLAERPGDADTRRWLLSLYREAARHEELARLLEETLAGDAVDDEERRLSEWELARVLSLALGRPADAGRVLERASEHSPDDEELLVARAELALRSGDFGAYLELRQKQAKLLGPALGALVLCHLAEACDETPGQQLRVAGLYREARNLDATNATATEALKAIGRRAKNWRALAALLPEPDEAKLSFSERAARLRALGDAAITEDPAKAGEWYLRAIAVDPDHYPAWDALAHLRAAAGDHAGALESQRASLAAYERSTPPAPPLLHERAVRIQALSEAFLATGDAETAARYALRAYRLVPTYARAALTVADQHLAAGEEAAAYALYDRVLKGPLDDEEERLHAMYQRGALARRLGKEEQGIADLRAALALNPLHGGAQSALAEAYAQSGRVAAAVQHSIQSLVVEYDRYRRGAIYARLGRLWEEKLGSPEESGVCYDLAISAGLTDGEVMLRALQHYRRQGRPERALAVIEQILPTTEDPRELAALWTERGAILAASGEEDQAVEAYDMALSYDPGNRGAISGLSRILERRGDWEQLAQIFESSIESGTPEERAEALRALARMASMHLGDAARAERYLRQVVELSPTKEDYEQLLALYGEDPANFNSRREALAGLLGLGGPYMARVIDFGQMLVATGERRWAWCLLSPLMSATLSDPHLKALVLELRKEFEKSDHTVVLTAETHRAVRHAQLDGPLFEVLVELDAQLTLGRATVEETGASGTGRLDERTAMGKTFAAIASRLGLEGTLLTRAQELSEPFLVLDGEQRHIVVRAELLQLLSLAETGFLFSTLCELTRPGVRLLASLAPAQRALLVPALFAALGIGTSPSGAEAMAAKIREGVSADLRTEWSLRLRKLEGAPEALGAALWQAMQETARRVGLVAAADLRFAGRMITRLDEALPKMQTVGKLDDLDDFIDHVPPVRSLLGFAVTPAFGQALKGA
jgi:tetratricopeptide (TPR) repeat protein